MRPPACVDCKHHKIAAATHLCTRGKKWDHVLGVEVTNSVDCYGERTNKERIIKNGIIRPMEHCEEQGRYFEKA